LNNDRANSGNAAVRRRVITEHNTCEEQLIIRTIIIPDTATNLKAAGMTMGAIVALSS
jgi:hypothetical protein